MVTRTRRQAKLGWGGGFGVQSQGGLPKEEVLEQRRE